MELGIHRGDEADVEHAVVKKRRVDEEGKPIGISNKNPLLDTAQYEVEFSNGDIEIMMANTIAENLLAQVDEEGHRQMLIDEIQDHCVTKDAIPKSKGTYETKRGPDKKIRATRGWEFYVQWKDGSGDWVSLKDLKDSYAIELADYEVNNQIDEEPALAWWVPYVIKKRKTIIKKVKSKYWQRTHTYELCAPKTIHEAKEIDKENGNTLWIDAVKLEMSNVMIAFEEIEDSSTFNRRSQAT